MRPGARFVDCGNVQYERPDPDALLASLGSSSGHRGRLKIFLGAAAGVGKTFAMLSEAHERIEKGCDLVVGYVEPHQRADTAALIKGLEVIPLREVSYKGSNLKEVDVPAIIERNPEVVLIDELAHSNAPGSVHAKRWQDVTDLLNAGISVYTAINVQHLESLNDVVSQVTGIRVSETVPDSFFSMADEIELIDLTPAELRQRLQDGKIYLPERVEHALDGFFKPSNLTALRELALRKAAETVDAEMQRLKVQEGNTATWATRDRIVVCIGRNRFGKHLVRTAARLAGSSKGDVIALYVDSINPGVLTPAVSDVEEALELARELGFEVVHQQSDDVPGAILQYARKKNASLLLVASSASKRPFLRRRSTVDRIIQGSGDIDVYVITPKEDAGEKKAPTPTDSPRSFGWAVSILAVAITTILGHFVEPYVGTATIPLIYILTVALASTVCTRLQSAVMSVASVGCFNFFLVDPRYTFSVGDPRTHVVFAVMMVLGLVISSLNHRLREHAASSTQRERRTASLYSLTRKLAHAKSKAEIAEAAATEIGSAFEGDLCIAVRVENRAKWMVPSSTGFEGLGNEGMVAEWVLEHGKEAGAGTDTFAGSKAVYLPLKGGDQTFGVLGFLGEEDVSAVTIERLASLTNTIGLALERSFLAKESNDAKVAMESEKTRSTVLSSISHDLRTPLTGITGAASQLLATGSDNPLVQTIYHESIRLNRQIDNLLDMTRLQAGGVKLDLQWQSPVEMVSAAIERSKNFLDPGRVQIESMGSIGLIQADAFLVEKALVNLLENALKHTPPETAIGVKIFAQERSVVILVSDEGPGFPPNAIGKVFTYGFTKGGSGFGLGLAIVESIMKLHGGKCSATNLPTGGAAIRLEFPLPSKQPEVTLD